MEKRLPSTRPILYLVTDRKALPGVDLLDLIVEAAAAEVDLIQIREKDLTDRQLCELVSEAVRRLQGAPTRLLVNDRFDIALAYGAHGVQLTSRSVSAEVVRPRVHDRFIIGASTHSLEELERADAQGADFALLGPIYDTPSKRVYGSPLGTAILDGACRRFGLPVLGIGGITLSRAQAIRQAGAAGIAAITLFAQPGRLRPLVGEIRTAWHQAEAAGSD